MDMETKISLREWAKENKVWEAKTWRVFLEKDLVPFYKYAFALNQLYVFLKSEKVCGKSSLGDIDDEMLRDKIRVAIYGGVEPTKDLNNSFAKFMFDNFGVCSENAPSFEESLKHYQSWGDGIKVSVNPNSWINTIPIGDLVNKLRDLIQWNLCKELGIKFADIGIQDSHPYAPLDSMDVGTLLPKPGDKPEKLISIVNEFRQKAVDLSIGVNPFMTFVFYARTIPLIVLMEFLECDMDKVTKLAKFLGLRAYSMIDQEEVDLPTKSPDKVILLMKGGYSKSGKTYWAPVAEKILEIQGFLVKMNPAIRETYENMIKEGINQIHINLEPWQDYKPIFSFLNEILKNKNNDWCSLNVDNGRVIKIRSGYREAELPTKIWLKDFLMKISPVVNIGIVNFSYDMTQLRFDPLTRDWVEKVIENEGKA
ncbi:Uncharacterised protein [uncultured archaeon]|nr:Uncharacterised protein [uncultured archaeon]